MWTSAQLDSWRAKHPSKSPARKRGEHPEIVERSAPPESDNLRAHLAFSTMRRRPILTTDLRPLTEDAMHTAAQELDAEIEQFLCQADLVQITVRYPAQLSVANLAKRLRGAASRAIRQSRDTRETIWANPYYAASINSHQPTGLSRYVEHLAQPVNN